MSKRPLWRNFSKLAKHQTDLEAPMKRNAPPCGGFGNDLLLLLKKAAKIARDSRNVFDDRGRGGQWHRPSWGLCGSRDLFPAERLKGPCGNRVPNQRQARTGPSSPGHGRVELRGETPRRNQHAGLGQVQQRMVRRRGGVWKSASCNTKYVIVQPLDWIGAQMAITPLRQ